MLQSELKEQALPTAVGRFRHQAREFAADRGASSAVQADVALAVSEAVTNAVRHAYESGEEGDVELTMSMRDGLIQVLVSDEGHGFRPIASTGLGLGLPIIAELTAHLEISQRSKGTDVLMLFHPC